MIALDRSAGAACQSSEVVLLPGSFCDERLFAPLLACLPERSWRLGDMHAGRSTAELADHLLSGAPERFALIGFSLGGLVALEVAARAPDRLAGLALVGTTGRRVPPAQREERRRVASAAVSLQAHVADGLLPRYALEAHRPALRDTIVDMARSCPPGTLLRQEEVALGRADHSSHLGAVRCPVLILAGAEDAINPPDVQRELADAFRSARLALVPEAGHFVLLEQPAPSARIMSEWLVDVDQHLETIQTEKEPS